MANEGPQLESLSDVDRQAKAMAESGSHIRSVQWQGQPAWLKLKTPRPPAWRYQLQSGMARLLRHPAMQPVRPHGGTAGIRNEAARLTALAAAGLRVPQVLAASDDWLLMSDLGNVTLESLMRRADAEGQLDLWQQGAAYIQQVHRAGHYLSQPFVRNLVQSPEQGLGAIDFEDDPLSVMSLTEAQIRDWIPYLFSTVMFFGDRLPVLTAAIQLVLADEDRAVREGVYRALRRTAWVRALRWLPQRMQRRDVLNTHAFGELARQCCQARLG
ncbi:MAG: hypothetical protein R6W97_04270 [Thiobacillus sp.]